MMKTVWIALFCFVLVGVPAHAKIYKWVDENGNTHFTNDPTKIPKKKNTKIETFWEIPPTVHDKTPGERSPSRRPEELMNKLGIPSESISQHGQNGLPRQIDENQYKDIQKQLETLQENVRKSQEAREQQFKAIDEFEGSQTTPKSGKSRYRKY